MNTKLLSKYKTTIMAVAIIMVTLHHFSFNVDRLPLDAFNLAVKEAMVVVDVFMLLSGFGIYISLSKSNRTYQEYIKRRALRLLPAYYPIIVVYLILGWTQGNLTLREVVSNLTFTAYWNGYLRHFNWYITAIVLFYLIAPFIFSFISKARNRGLSTLMLCLAIAIFNLGFIGLNGYTIIARLPIFVYGMYLGSRYMNQDEKPENKTWIAYVIISLLCLGIYFVLMYYGDNYLFKNMELWSCFECYVSGMGAPGAVILIIALFGLIYKIPFVGKWIESLMNIIGAASFEIYMLHLLVLFFNPDLSYVVNSVKVLWIIGAVAGGILYRYIVDKVKTAILSKNQKQ